MPRGRVVIPKVIAQVGQLLSEDEKMTGSGLKAAVEAQIRGVDYTVRTYQLIKERLKPTLDEIKSSGIDEPWHTGTLIDYPLPAEALPHILEVQDITRDVFTIRQARWVARFYTVIKDAPTLNMVSFLYALSEKAAKFVSAPFNYLKYDRLLTSPQELINTLKNDLGHKIIDGILRSNEIETDTEMAGGAVPYTDFYIFDDAVYVHNQHNNELIPLEMGDTLNAEEQILENARQAGVKIMSSTDKKVRILRWNNTTYRKILAKHMVRLQEKMASEVDNEG
jgi:hypothetical protein